MNRTVFEKSEKTASRELNDFFFIMLRIDGTFRITNNMGDRNEIAAVRPKLEIFEKQIQTVPISESVV